MSEETDHSRTANYASMLKAFRDSQAEAAEAKPGSVAGMVHGVVSQGMTQAGVAVVFALLSFVAIGFVGVWLTRSVDGKLDTLAGQQAGLLTRTGQIERTMAELKSELRWQSRPAPNPYNYQPPRYRSEYPGSAQPHDEEPRPR